MSAEQLDMLRLSAVGSEFFDQLANEKPYESLSEELGKTVDSRESLSYALKYGYDDLRAEAMEHLEWVDEHGGTGTYHYYRQLEEDGREQGWGEWIGMGVWSSIWIPIAPMKEYHFNDGSSLRLMQNEPEVADAMAQMSAVTGLPATTKGIVNTGKTVVNSVKSLAAKLAKSSTDDGAKELLEEVATRITREGDNAVRIEYPDGSIKDISSKRVKEFIPNTHPQAPSGTLQKVKFDNALPGSKGYKRAPTSEEIEFLESL